MWSFENMTLTSIVMLCWNRKDDVRESLLRIRGIDYPNIEVIVVDNASTDGTIEMIEKEFPEVHLIKMYKNLGIEAYNIGFEQAKGEYIVIIDDDSFPAKNAISRMVDKFQINPKLGVVAFDVRNFYHYDEIVTMDERNSETTQSAAIAKKYYMGFNGAGAGIRRDLFRRIGYYPEEFFLYNNEMDTAFRVWNSGYTIEFHSDVISYHKYSPVNRLSWRAPFYYTRNAYWLVWKNYYFTKAIAKTIDILYKCVYASLEQKTTVYVKATFAAFFGIKNIKGKRRPVSREVAENLRVPFDTFFTFYR
jgi:GT2 family glycosyltransferase